MKIENKAEDVQRDFLKYLGQEFKNLLEKNDEKYLEQFKVGIINSGKGIH